MCVRNSSTMPGSNGTSAPFADLSSPFQMVGTATHLVAAAGEGGLGSATFQVRFIAPETPGQYDAHINFAVSPGDTYPPCSGVNPPLPQLGAEGFSQTGSPGLNPEAPTTIELSANCTTSPADTIITITNNGNNSMTYTASFLEASPHFTLSADGTPVTTNSVSVGIGGTSLLTITHGAGFPFGAEATWAYTDHLRVIVTSNMVFPPFDYVLHTTPVGDVISFSAAGLDFSNSPLTTLGTGGQSQTLTLTNAGFASPPLGLVPKANVDLTIVDNTDDFSFCPQTYSHAGGCDPVHKSVTVNAGGGTTPVTVYYVPSYTGHADHSSTTGHILWSIASDPSCMGSEAPAARTLDGSTKIGVVTSAPAAPVEFGTQYCGATAAVQLLTITNNGTTAFTITGFTLAPFDGSTDGSQYYAIQDGSGNPIVGPGSGSALPTADSAVVPPLGGTQTFQIVPQMIDHQLTHGDLDAASNKFKAHLSFTTDVKMPFGTALPAIDTHTVTLNMHAQGVIIGPVAGKPTWAAWADWTFGNINWPGSTLSTDHRSVDNQGNVNAIASMTISSPDASPYFSLIAPTVMQPTAGAPPVTAVLNTEYGEFPTSPCNTHPRQDIGILGSVILKVAPPTDPGIGICIDPADTRLTVVGGNAAWVQPITLTVNLLVTGTPCLTGQRCDTTLADSTYGQCICDTESCGSGCCIGIANGICTPYASQNGTHCGQAGAQCNTCTGGLCSNTTGICLCAGTFCPGTGTDTGACVNLTNNANNCGSCGNVCPVQEAGAGRVCSGSQCRCNATSCPHGCCSGGTTGVCELFSSQTRILSTTAPVTPGCGSGGGTCVDCGGQYCGGGTSGGTCTACAGGTLVCGTADQGTCCTTGDTCVQGPPASCVPPDGGS